MKKAILTLSSLLTIILLASFLIDDTSILQHIPSQVAPGGEFTVEVIIKKGSATGFAQFKTELPEGFTVSPQESAGGEFKFSNQVLRITWTNLPADNEFKVKYNVMVDNKLSGTKSITANFTFSKNNSKNTLEATPAEIIVGKPTPIEDLSNLPSTAALAIATKDSAHVFHVSVVTKRVCPLEVTAGDEFDVTVTITKESLTGFLRFQDDLPEGLNAIEKESKGGSFSFIDNTVKIVWETVPTDPEFTISYRAKATTSVSGNRTISGLLSYTDNNEPKKHKMINCVINVKNSYVAPTNLAILDSTPNTTSEKTVQQIAATAVQSLAVAKDVSATTPSSAATPTVTETAVTNIPSPKVGVAYKIQICAAHKQVEENYLKSKYNITDKINFETHQGWNKYTVGGFDIYKDARDYRENVIAKNVSGAFITAYNSGSRITVQEALMLTKQPWVR